MGIDILPFKCSHGGTFWIPLDGWIYIDHGKYPSPVLSFHEHLLLATFSIIEIAFSPFEFLIYYGHDYCC